MTSTPSMLSTNTDITCHVTTINGMTVEQYVDDLYAKSVWVGSKHDGKHRHYVGVLQQHVEHLLQTTTLNTNNHTYSSVESAIKEYNEADDEEEKDALLFSPALKIVYDLTCDGNVVFDKSVLVNIIAGKTRLHGRTTSLVECNKCGKQTALTLCGNKLTVDHTECVPVGYYEVDVHFPTGRLVIDDCIHEVHDYIETNYAKETDNFGMQHAASHRDISACYARAGMCHVFVGNSCPDINLDRDHNVITIGNPGRDDDDYKDTDPLPGVALGSICTDLWWASMIDVRTFKKHLKKQHGWQKGSRLFKQVLTGDYPYDIIEVPAGTYTMKSFHHIDGYPDNFEHKHVMATLTKK